jgi:ABC-type transport system involved in cytochrome c biogenesis ATPase subunit
MTAGGPFLVLPGPEGAGRSSVMRRLAGLPPEWRLVSTDSALVAPAP